jgi:predicted  nucleic acid-binding Zn-ribbon protein
MQPEISHRCASCGASVREPAMFCPECGKPLAPAAPKAPKENASPEAEQPTAAEIPDPAAISTTELVASSMSPLAGPPVERAVVPRAAKADPVSRRKQPDQPTEPGARPGTRERTREKLHRASSVARGALEENVKRVEKIHDFSATMLEEAHYDPSLRFVLVALGLFIVFVILLVLSKVMG